MIAIAIDGPSGAGKSTVAKAVAKMLNFIYVDTGALYRSIAYFAYTKGANTKSSDEVAPLLKEINLEIKYIDGEQRVILNSKDVSEDIRKPHISMLTSNVSTLPQVREFLLYLQKDIASKNNVVMDGRDIGTVVLPQAKVKIFLTASAEKRARRRYEDFLKQNSEVQYEDILSDIIARDLQDENRAIAPLKKSDDAIEIDSTELTIAQVSEKIISVLRERE